MSSLGDLPDNLNQLMQPLGGRSDPSTSLREIVLAQTVGVIRTRKRLKRVGYAAALVCCYMAGLGTMSLWKSSNAVETDAPIAAVLKLQSDHPASTQQLAVQAESDQQSRDVADSQAAAKLTPYDRLRLAGDRQLDEEHDIAAAARTYRRALQVASTEQRAFSVDRDTWLLMAMKNDQSVSFSENIP